MMKLLHQEHPRKLQLWRSVFTPSPEPSSEVFTHTRPVSSIVRLSKSSVKTNCMHGLLGSMDGSCNHNMDSNVAKGQTEIPKMMPLTVIYCQENLAQSTV